MIPALEAIVLLDRAVAELEADPDPARRARLLQTLERRLQVWIEPYRELLVALDRLDVDLYTEERSAALGGFINDAVNRRRAA